MVRSPPIRRITDADRITATVIFTRMPYFLKTEKNVRGISRWYCQLWRRRECIQYPSRTAFSASGKLRRLAKINGARHRAMVAFITTGDLSKKVLVLFRIGESSQAGQNEVRRHLFPMAIAGRWPDSRRQNRRRRGYRYHKFQPPRSHFYACLPGYVHKSGYAYSTITRGDPHIFDFLCRFHCRLLPVYQRRRIWQSELQEDALAERQKLSR